VDPEDGELEHGKSWLGHVCWPLTRWFDAMPV